MRRVVQLLATIALLACRPDPAVDHPKPTPPAPADGGGNAGVDPELVRTLAILATHEAPALAAIEATKRDLDRKQLTMAQYIDSLVANPRFAADVAPVIVFRGLLSMNNQIGGYFLKHTAEATPIYYLRKPCTAAQTIAVRPWWNLDTEIHVCPDSYLPQKWMADTKRGAPEMACMSFLGRDGGCGCGPNLVRCFESKDAARHLQQSMRDEVRRTVAHVVGEGQPIDTVFSSNETWRDRDVELFQRRQAIEAQQIKNPEPLLREVATWPTDGKWAARQDLATGHNAGLLTAAQLIMFFPDRRQRMTTLYDVLWCDEPSSAGATPELVSKIAGATASFQLTQDHWKELAARPICTECHARLDYGLQFFQGFDNSDLRAFYAPALQHAQHGPLYARNIEDPRGEDELSPRGFAKLAIAQPEHTRCMARDFAEYALSNRATAETIDRLAAQVKPGVTTAQQLMRAALLEVVDAWTARSPAVTPAPPPATVATAEVPVSPALRRTLDDTCSDCHHGDANVPDFSVNTLPRDTAVAMLDAVAFGAMPKDHALPAAQRAAWLEPLIGALWSGADASTARDYYIGRMTALPAYRPEVMFDLVHQRAHGAGSTWRLMERSTRPSSAQASPGAVTAAALEAIESCKQHNAKRAEIDACIAAALRVEDIAIDNRRP